MTKYTRHALFVLGAVVAVEVTMRLLKVPTYLVPLPTEVLHSLRENFSFLLENFVITFAEATLGFLIANTISIALALFMHFYPKAENYIITFGVIIKTIPIIALTPLLIIWLGPGMASKMATAALICFFPSLVSMTQGMKELNSDYGDIFRLYNASKTKVTKHLLLPGSKPFLIASLKVSSSLAVVGALVGEFIGASQGLGFVIITSYYSFDIPMVFSAILLSSAMGLGLYYAVEMISRTQPFRITRSNDNKRSYYPPEEATV